MNTSLFYVKNYCDNHTFYFSAFNKSTALLHKSKLFAYNAHKLIKMAEDWQVNPLQQDIYPIRIVKPMAGKSEPHLVEFSDNLQYVVKFKNSRHGTRALVNEYVVGELAKILTLPVAPFRIAHFSNVFMNQQPTLTQYGFEAGNQFASLYIKNCRGLPREEGHVFPTAEEIENATDAAGIIVLDLWVSNVDRGSQNFLLEFLPDERYHIYMIDHGNCFPRGFYWTINTLKETPKKVYKTTSNLWCASLLKNREEFTPFLKAIQSIPDQKIKEIMQTIPEDWQITGQEREALAVHLINGKKVLPSLIQKFSAKIKMGEPFIKKKKTKKK